MRAPPAERPPNLARVVADIREELATREPLPPGELGFSLFRTHRFQRATLQALLDITARSWTRVSSADGEDVLSVLLEARDEQGDGFIAVELRDPLMHLLFGGHDTTSSTVSFLLSELSRHPEAAARVLEEQDAVLGGRPPAAEDLIGGLPYLSMAVDETLRLYPPVWFGPRMSVSGFEFGGYHVPAGVHVIHSSWVSHRLPEVFPNPEAFIPERFVPEARRMLPPGAYIPFGGGQRVCIGKRFGQLVVKAATTTLLQRFRCELKRDTSCASRRSRR